ncbi:MAG: sulfatase [Chloroflexota bacterium]|nr:sulfatase [Chloroflexota bacterium]
MISPNILFLHTHNTGRHVQPYGYAVPTPNLQRLAEEGVLFRQAFSTAPTCSPSRASFLSGLYPHTCGMSGLAHRGFRMSDYRQHLVHGLSKHGYHTVLSGIEATTLNVSEIGYDQILSDLDVNYPHQTRPSDPAQAAADFLTNSPPEPFFLSVGLEETHRPFPQADSGAFVAEDPRYCRPPNALPDTSETRRDMANFKASARIMDQKIGTVLQVLEDANLVDDTLVFCFSDHGLQFPRHMATLSDRGIGVFLVVRGPGGFQGGQVIDAMVSLIDMVPTVYDLAGIAPTDRLHGKSLRPLVNGEVSQLHEVIFAESSYHAAYEPMRCIRTERYKYIKRFDDRDGPVLANVDRSPSKDVLLDHGWAGQPCPREMLFDLVFDPNETCNLIEQPELAAVGSDLRARLAAWMAETGDPLLTQTIVPAPPGARIDDADAAAPNTVLYRLEE